MALILNLETATEVCSVALAENGRLLSLKEEKKANFHSSVLTILVQNVFKEANRKIKETDAVAVSAGPGSFTGLRIGASAAKGLCCALNKPLIAVPTLMAMTYGAVQFKKDDDACYCPAIESIKDEVFTGLYTSSLKEIVAAAPQDYELKNLLPHIENRKVFAFGNGSVKLSVPGLVKLTISNSAINMIALSQTLFLERRIEPLDTFEPQYLKNFIPRKDTL